MLTYQEAKDQLARGRNGRKKLQNNTYLESRGDDAIAVVLHGTDVVTIHGNGLYTLESGGWRTVTTKDRINEYSPARVYSESGVWKLWRNRQAIALFDDGIQVDVDGQPVGAFRAPDALQAPKHRLDRMIREFIKAYCAHVADNGLELPGGGDCFGCAFRAGNDNPEPLGYDHYLSHFREGYFVPSILWSALQRCGDPSFVFGMIRAQVARGDTSMVAMYLRSFFRKMKPKLLECLEREGAEA